MSESPEKSNFPTPASKPPQSKPPQLPRLSPATKIVGTIAGITAVAKAGPYLLEALHTTSRGSFSSFRELVADVFRNIPGFLPYFALFLVSAFFLVKLIYAFPLRVNWEQIEKYSKDKKVRWAPVVVIAVMILTNFFPSSIVNSFYSERVFVSYLASLSFMLSQVVVTVRKPADVENHPFDRPVSRYAAVVLYGIGLFLGVMLSLALFPATIKMAPDVSFKDIIWPVP